MNALFRTALSAILLACLATGCATKALLKAANEETRAKAEGVVRVVSASREGDMGYLCLQRSTADQRTSSYWLPIPLADAHNFYLHDTSGRPPVLKITAEQARPRACATKETDIALIEVGDQDRIALAPGQKEAIYIKYADGNLLDLGYVSTLPLHNSPIQGDPQYGYALDLSDTDILWQKGKKRSHLLLLLPVSVATDVAAGVGYTVVGLAYFAGIVCNSTPGGCKGGR